MLEGTELFCLIFENHYLRTRVGLCWDRVGRVLVEGKGAGSETASEAELEVFRKAPSCSVPEKVSKKKSKLA